VANAQNSYFFAYNTKDYPKDANNRVFSDESIREEQLSCARWFEGLGIEKEQEW
jgi:hypothetical protein